MFARDQGEVHNKLLALTYNDENLSQSIIEQSRYETYFKNCLFAETEENMKIYNKNINYLKNRLFLVISNKIAEKKSVNKNDKLRVKSELQDLTAIMDCLIERDLIDLTIIQMHEKVSSDTLVHDINQEGRTTIKNFWKSSAEKAEYASLLDLRIR